jgi:hypothetical protein
MIKLNKLHKHMNGTQAIAGTLKVEVIGYKSLVATFIIYVENTLHTETDTIQRIGEIREKQFSLAFFEETSEALQTAYPHLFNGLNGHRSIMKVIDLMELNIMQTDLFEDGTTSFGYLPTDWIKDEDYIWE